MKKMPVLAAKPKRPVFAAKKLRTSFCINNQKGQVIESNNNLISRLITTLRVKKSVGFRKKIVWPHSQKIRLAFHKRDNSKSFAEEH